MHIQTIKKSRDRDRAAMNSSSRDYRKNHRAIPKQKKKETPQEIGTEKHQNTTYHSLSGRNQILKDHKFREQKKNGKSKTIFKGLS
jgi:hypothetical protein